VPPRLAGMGCGSRPVRLRRGVPLSRGTGEPERRHRLVLPLGSALRNRQEEAHGEGG